MKTALKILGLACLVTGIVGLAGCKKESGIPIINTVAVSQVTLNSAVVSAAVISDGGAVVTSRGVCWNTVPDPSIADHSVPDGSGLGSFNTSITGLEQNTTYYVRAYAGNIEGISYGNEVSFRTGNPVPPTLTTVFVHGTITSVVVGGNITDIGNEVGEIVERGVCWSTTPLPTIKNENLSDGTGSGSFTIELFNLNPGTTYFVRAYVVNSENSVVTYGNQISFTTYQTGVVSNNEFPGGGRYDAVSFAIGSKVYAGLGVNDSDFTGSDFWEWDPSTGIWTRLAYFPGDLGNENLAFSIGSKGYVSSSIWSDTGYIMNTFWEYDPMFNSWTQKASLPVTPGSGAAIGFSIGNKGYIGIGFLEVYNGLPLNYFNDFWEWDQATDVWTRKASFPGNNPAGAVGFSIGNKGYIGTGTNGTSLSNEFWEWDQATNIWTRKADFGGDPRSNAVGFSIGNKGYIGTGYSADENLYLLQDFWEWDQTTDIWVKVADFNAGPRANAIGVSNGNKAYIGTGSDYTSAYVNDFWEYVPGLK